jgi:hypothetical protein
MDQWAPVEDFLWGFCGASLPHFTEYGQYDNLPAIKGSTISSSSGPGMYVPSQQTPKVSHSTHHAAAALVRMLPRRLCTDYVCS